MALLHYENLGIQRPDILLGRVVSNLHPFYWYLRHTKTHLEQESALPRLACAVVDADDRRRRAKGVWVELQEPADKPNEPQQTFDAFLDEDVREVHESEPRGPDRDRLARIPPQERRISVLGRNPSNNRLCLERVPRHGEIVLRANTTTLKRQLDAVQDLRNSPTRAHLPLLRLFESAQYAQWPPLPPLDYDPRWQVLTDGERAGTPAQRKFVETALKTPDFAILEGPPGSGKTTAICELILQLVEQGKRVLLCASTHVAVDNVLERLTPYVEKEESELVPVRVGDRLKISDGARKYQLEELARTERERLLGILRGKPERSDAQEHFFQLLRSPAEGSEVGAIERLFLDGANLVCGTTAGIVTHPDIRAAHKRPSARAGMFDMLILDEASKTTFQEFLIPALLARRWVVVGDPRQLSPFLDDAAVAANLRAALPDPVRRNASVDVFLAHQEKRPRTAVVKAEASSVLEAYQRQAAAHEVVLCEPHENDTETAGIIVGDENSLQENEDRLPADIATVRGLAHGPIFRRATAWRIANDISEEPPVWEDELAWRLCRLYELRQSSDAPSTKPYQAATNVLLPASAPGDAFPLSRQVDQVRRVAFPSILESLQRGFERDEKQRDGNALSDGLPNQVFRERHVLLEYQHRMHPEISAFPRENVYASEALHDPPDMAARRQLSYPRFQRRLTWLDVRGTFDRRRRNPKEAEAVVRELQAFWGWARTNRKSNDADEPWEIAILTFYRGQERELRERLQALSRSRNSYRYFDLGAPGRPDARVELCTVDRFQGHEADVVFLSIGNTWCSSFLESTNRVNVALTRARYLCVVVGKREGFKGKAGNLLHALASDPRWEHSFGGVDESLD